MTEDDLERLLRQTTPAGPTPSLEARISEALHRPATPARLSLSDRFLLAAISSGFIAACLIVALLASDAANSASRSQQQTSRTAPAVTQQRLLAQLLREADRP